MEVPSRGPFQPKFRDSFHSSTIKVISALMWLKETLSPHWLKRALAQQKDEFSFGFVFPKAEDKIEVGGARLLPQQ